MENKEGVYSDLLKCNWMSVHVASEKNMVIIVPKYNCTDMTGAINFATRINRKVTGIMVCNSDGPDIAYQKVGRKWVCCDVKCSTEMVKNETA